MKNKKLEKIKKKIWNQNIKEGNMNKNGTPRIQDDEHFSGSYNHWIGTIGLVLCRGCLKPFYKEGFKKGDIFGWHENHLECMKIRNWGIGQKHLHYGKVVMMRTIEGEPYRFFSKDGDISMIPLSSLQLNEGEVLR